YQWPDGNGHPDKHPSGVPVARLPNRLWLRPKVVHKTNGNDERANNPSRAPSVPRHGFPQFLLPITRGPNFAGCTWNPLALVHFLDRFPPYFYGRRIGVPRN